MNKGDPVWEKVEDVRTFTAIRSTQLDVFWARRPGTVIWNLTRLRLQGGARTTQCGGRLVVPLLPLATAQRQSGDGASQRHATCLHAHGKALQKGTARFSSTNPHCARLADVSGQYVNSLLRGFAISFGRDPSVLSLTIPSQ